MMSWFHPGTRSGNARNHASPADIVACFRFEEGLLHKLAFLITADQSTAKEAVATACQITLRGDTPFCDWLLEWAKVVTITTAISLHREAIRACEPLYKGRQCPHVEHSSQFDDDRREARLALLLQMDAQQIFTELDRLCRAILVLRVASRSSIQDCSLRLNVSRAAVLVANCHAMTWLDHSRITAASE